MITWTELHHLLNFFSLTINSILSIIKKAAGIFNCSLLLCYTVYITSFIKISLA